MTQQNTARHESVNNVYTAPVYPARDVTQERNTLHANDVLSFDALNHFGWAGKRDLRKGARILVVGEGNGDATVLLAEQARDTSIEIIAIDTSEEAIAVSKARLAQRGLSNVVHHHISLVSLHQANLGEFDIIECSNVLDHIEDPVAGLSELTRVLKEDGLLVLALNSTYGRLQLFMIQALMQHLIDDYMPREVKIQIVREFLSSVPADHLLGHDNADFLAEIEKRDGSGIEALFLQPYNHTFVVAELYQLLDAVGLALVSFAGAERAKYKIETYTKSDMVLGLVKDRQPYERDIIADVMSAGIRNHRFYAAFQDKMPAQMADDMVIVLAPSMTSAEELSATVPASANRDALLATIDGKRTVAEILATVKKADRAELETLYQALNENFLAFLRHAECAANPNNREIQERLASIPAITFQ